MRMQNSATHNKGQIAVMTVILMGILASIIMVLTGTLLNNTLALRRSTDFALGQQLAESGIDRGLWCLNHPANCPANYSGETTTQGAGSYTLTLTTAGSKKIATSVATVHKQTHTIQTTVQNTSSTNASFFYGVQTGVGGVTMSNNASIVGNLYTGGSVTGSNGSSITGDVILTPGSPTLDVVSNPPVSPLNTRTLGDASSTTYLAQSFVSGFDNKVYSIDAKLAQHGSPTSAVTLYIYTDNAGSPGTNLSGSGQTVTVAIPADTSPGWETAWTNQVFNPGTTLIAGTKYWLVMKVSATNATKYWVSVKDTTDTSYSNGTAKISSNGTSWNTGCTTACDIALRTNMGGVEPTLNIPTVGGNAYAYKIDNTNIGKDAYYQQLDDTVKANTIGIAETCLTSTDGTHCHRNSTDQPAQNFPLSDAQIATMEAQAAAGGTVTCSPTCNIGTSTIGPKKYVGDVTITNSAVVTLNGTVWVSGNIIISNGAILKLASSYGSNSGVIIADDPSNPTTKGSVTLSNNGDLQGNGTADTYIMVIGMNADPTFVTPAITVANNLTAGILYAQNGLVTISNNAALKEVTAQQLSLSNNASVTYQSGLASIVFTSGPGGAWQIQPKTWQDLH